MFEAINTRLSIQARLILIGSLFVAPIALLVFLFVESALTDISFAGRELDGSTYLVNVWSGFIKTAIDNTPVADALANRAASIATFGRMSFNTMVT